MSDHRISLTADVKIDQSVSADGEQKSRSFKIDPAYSGGTIAQVWTDLPVVIDLAGMDFDAPGGQLHALAYHDFEQWAGVIREQDVHNTGQSLHATGEFFDEGDATADMVLRKGLKATWQASIGAPIHEIEQIEAGESVEVNGRRFDGPLLVARRTSLQEISFVTRGADNTTRAAVFATRTQPEGSAMAETNTPDALQAKRTREQEIKAEFGSDKDFAFDAVVGEESMEILRLKFERKQTEAQRVEAEQLRAQLAEANAKIEAAKAAPATPAVSAAGIGGAAPVVQASAEKRFKALVEAEVQSMRASGVQPVSRQILCSANDTLKAMATQRVIQASEEARQLHRAWIAEANSQGTGLTIGGVR